MTEEQTTPEEPAVFSGDFDGLKKAAAELNDARESGQPISAPEPEPRELPDDQPVREVRVNADDTARWNQERAPYLPYRDKMYGELDARQAAETVAQQRSEGDERLRELLENDLDLRQQVLDSVDEQNRASEQLSQTAAEAQAQIDAIKADRDAKAAEIEQRKQAEAAAAYREAQLIALAGEAGRNKIAEAETEGMRMLASKYPEMATAYGAQKVAAENPHRYQEYLNDYQVAQTLVKSAAFDQMMAQAQLNQQRQQAAVTAAKSAVDQVRASRSDYQGDAGLAKMRADMNAAIEARVAHGEDREAVLADIDRAENYTPGNIEAFLSMGREYRARQGLESKRARPKLPPVMKPGAARDPRGGDYSEVTALDKKLNATHNVKDAGKLLAAMRRASR